MKNGRLYIVSTPIGNLKDMTYRAVEILEKASMIIAEDTRVSGVLLSHYGIKTRTVSYHKFNEKKRAGEVLAALEAGGDVALISDAGTPLLSDPGFEIVRACAERGIEASPVPGASSVLAALTVSGFEASPFVFLGFMPRKEGELRKKLEEIGAMPYAVVAFESPQRVAGTLAAAAAIMPHRQMCVAKEMTKVHETLFRGSAAEIREKIAVVPVKGEFVLVFGPLAAAEADVPDEKVFEMVSELERNGQSRSAAIKTVSEMTGLPKNKVYKIAHKNWERVSRDVPGR